MQRTIVTFSKQTNAPNGKRDEKRKHRKKGKVPLTLRVT